MLKTSKSLIYNDRKVINNNNNSSHYHNTIQMTTLAMSYSRMSKAIKLTYVAKIISSISRVTIKVNLTLKATFKALKKKQLKLRSKVGVRHITRPLL